MAQGKFGDYAQVEKTIEGVGAPLELADLRRSLGSGKLSQPGMLDTLKSLTGGGTTAMGYNRNQVLCQLAQDLGRTDELFQKGSQPDCGGMATEYLFAQTNPAEYAKAVRDLAETGKVKIGDLELTASREDARDLRGPSQRLFAESFVRAAGGEGNGLVADQMKDALGKATGRSWDAMYLAQPDKGQGTAEEAAQTQANFVKELDSVVFNPAVSHPAARGNPVGRTPAARAIGPAA